MSNIPGVKSNVHVDVYNADGSLAQHEEGHNYITEVPIRLAKIMLKDLLAKGKAYNSGVPSTYSYSSFSDYNKEVYTHMYCTDDTSPEDTSVTEVKGNTVAYATLSTSYAQSSGTRGSISVPQSDINSNRAKFVAEWVEATGNGTFQSVMIGSSLINYALIDNVINGDTQGCSMLADGGDCYYVVKGYSKTIYKVDKTTFETIETYDLGAEGLPYDIGGLTYHNGFIYVGLNSDIYKYNVSNGDLVVFNSQNSAALGTDGTYLYASYNKYIYKINLSTSANVSSVYIGTQINGIARVGDKLYASGGSKLFELDESDMSIINETNFNSVLGSLLSIDGMLLCLALLHATISQSDTISKYMLCKIDDMRINNMFNRVLLPNPVTKDETQTMKVTMQINFG